MPFIPGIGITRFGVGIWIEQNPNPDTQTLVPFDLAHPTTDTTSWTADRTVLTADNFAQGFRDIDGFYAPASVAYLAPLTVVDTDNCLAPAASASAALVPTTAYSDADGVYVPGLAGIVTLQAAIWPDSEGFYAPSVGYGLSPQIIADADAILVPGAQSGAATLTPSLVADPDAYYPPGFSQVALPTLVTDTDAIAATNIRLSTQFLSPLLWANDDAVYPGGLALGGNLLPALYPDVDAFAAAAVIPGAVVLQPAALPASDTIFAANSGAGLLPSLLADNDTVPLGVIGQSIIFAPGLVSDTETFYRPQLVASVALLAVSVADVDSLPSPRLLPGVANLHPSPYQDVDDILPPRNVGQTAATLRPALVYAFDRFPNHKVVGGLQPVHKPPMSGSVSDPAYMFGTVSDPAYMFSSVSDPKYMIGTTADPAYMIGTTADPRKLRGSMSKKAA